MHQCSSYKCCLVQEVIKIILLKLCTVFSILCSSINLFYWSGLSSARSVHARLCPPPISSYLLYVCPSLIRFGYRVVLQIVVSCFMKFCRSLQPRFTAWCAVKNGIVRPYTPVHQYHNDFCDLYVTRLGGHNIISPSVWSSSSYSISAMSLYDTLNQLIHKHIILHACVALTALWWCHYICHYHGENAISRLAQVMGDHTKYFPVMTSIVHWKIAQFRGHGTSSVIRFNFQHFSLEHTVSRKRIRRLRMYLPVLTGEWDYVYKSVLDCIYAVVLVPHAWNCSCEHYFQQLMRRCLFGDGQLATNNDQEIGRSLAYAIFSEHYTRGIPSTIHPSCWNRMILVRCIVIDRRFLILTA